MNLSNAWLPYRLVKDLAPFKRIGGGNTQQNRLFFLALAVLEATSNRVWAKYSQNPNTPYILLVCPRKCPYAYSTGIAIGPGSGSHILAESGSFLDTQSGNQLIAETGTGVIIPPGGGGGTGTGGTPTFYLLTDSGSYLINDNGGRFLLDQSGPGTAPAAPAAPILVGAVAGDTFVDLTASAQANNGSTITSYIWTPTPATSPTTQTSTTPTYRYTGLTDLTSYTFVVQAVNSVGPSPVSNASNPVTPTAVTVPGKPLNVAATAGNASAVVTWDTPLSDGGDAIIDYIVRNVGTGTTYDIHGVANTYTVTGLVNNTATSFQVLAVNGQGQGLYSAVSNTVTPATSPLAFPASPAATTTATAGGVDWLNLQTTGGKQPAAYSITSQSGSSKKIIQANDGWFSSRPTAAGTDTAVVRAIDQQPTTLTKTYTQTIDTTTLRFTQFLRMPDGNIGRKFYWAPVLPGAPGFGIAGGSGTKVYSATGLPAGLTCSSTTCEITGTPTGSANNYTVTLSCTDTSGTATCPGIALKIGAANSAARPTGNTGSGYFTAGKELYAPDGQLMRLRGTNRAHFDSPGGTNLPSNSERMFLYILDGSISFNSYLNSVKAIIDSKKVPIITAQNSPVWRATGSITGTVLTVTAINYSTVSPQIAVGDPLTSIGNSPTITSFGTGTGGLGTYNLSAAPQGGNVAAGSTIQCSPGTSGGSNTRWLQATTDWWVNNVANWGTYLGTPILQQVIINHSNEWGPFNGGVAPGTKNAAFQTSVKSYISALRTAGYTDCPIMVDTSEFGQCAPDTYWGIGDFTSYDPQHNIVMSFHLYGGDPVWTTVSQLNSYCALLKTQPGCVVFGEWGPYRQGQSSQQTQFYPSDVVATLEANDIGHLPWALDDHISSSPPDVDSSFGMAYDWNNPVTTPAGLTNWGHTVFTHPVTGLHSLAQRSTFYL